MINSQVGSKWARAHARGARAPGHTKAPALPFPAWFVVVIMIPVMLGCRPTFSGKIAVQNETGQSLEEVHVRGFRRNPPMGSLGIGSGGSGWMDPMPLPSTARITWKPPDGKDREAEVDLTQLSPIPNGTLVFEIQPDQSVKARFDQ